MVRKRCSISWWKERARSTRIRRRIAEEMPFSDVHLIFVINEFGSSIYKSILLSDEGKVGRVLCPRLSRYPRF